MIIERPTGFRVLAVGVRTIRPVPVGTMPAAHLAQCLYSYPLSVGPSAIVAQLAPPGGRFSPVRLAVLGRSRRVITIARIRAGVAGRTPAQRHMQRNPAVVVGRSRAFVVGRADEPIARVDLLAGTVSYATAAPRLGSLQSRSSDRFGALVGSNRLLVSGWDDLPPPLDPAPIGAVLVDARSGATRKLDPGATWVWATAKALLARRDDGSIRAFDYDGSPRFTIDDSGVGSGLDALFDNGRFLYVPTDAGPRVYDLTTGALLGTGSRDLGSILSPADRNAAWGCS